MGGAVAVAAVIYFGARGSFLSNKAPAPVTVTANTAAQSLTVAPASIPPSSVPTPMRAAPQQSEPLKKGEIIPAKAIGIMVSTSGFSPHSFTVRAGDAVMLALTSGDQFAHVLAFSDGALASFVLAAAAGETRTIQFTAPKRGEYAFSDTIPGHAARGETGIMVVQ